MSNRFREPRTSGTKWTLVVSGLLVAVMLFHAAAVDVSAQASIGHWKVGDTWNLTFGSATQTGSYFAGMSAVATLLTAKLPNVRATATVSPQMTTEVYPQMFRAERAGGVGSYDMPLAYDGIGPWKNRRIPILGWTYVQEGFYNVLVKASLGMTTIYDLKGSGIKVAATATPPRPDNPDRWDQPFSFFHALLTAHGLDPFKDVQVVPYGTSEAIVQLRDGNIDGMSHSRALGDAAVMELTQTRDVVLLQPDPAVVDKVIENYPSYVESVPRDVWPDMIIPEPGLGFFHGVYFFLHADLPDELVYEMTKTLWENIDVLRNSHPAYKDLELKDALKGMPIPPHPGALRYYAEQGVPGVEDWL